MSSLLSVPTVDCTLAAPVTVCVLTIIPTILWGLTPVLVKYALSRGGSLMQAIVVILAVDTGVLWLAMVAIHGPKTILNLSPAAIGLFAIAGILGTAIGRIVVYSGIDRLGAAINTACLSTRPLFATLFGVLALGEHVGMLTLLGVVILTAGLAFLALSKGGDVSGWHPRDILFPLTGAALFAGANVIRRSGLHETAIPPLAAVTINETVALLAILGYVVARGKVADVRGPTVATSLFALAGAVTAIGMVSVFSALGHPAGRVVFVDPLIAAAPLFTTVFAYFLLQDVERITRGIVIGAITIVAGAVLVILG